MQPILRRLLLLILVLVAIEATSQSYIMIKGQVWDLAGSELTGAHAFNKTRHYGTFTNIDGIFYLVMVPGDSLRVSMIGYKPYNMKVPEKLSATSYKLDITLLADTILLKETTIKPYPETYAEFRKEFLELKAPEEKIYSRIVINEDFGSKYSNPEGGLILPGPIGLLYNAFSKEGKEIKKMNVILARDHLREQLLSIITREILNKRFKLNTDDEIDAMMSECGITKDFLSRHSGYAIIQHIQRCRKVK